MKSRGMAHLFPALVLGALGWTLTFHIASPAEPQDDPAAQDAAPRPVAKPSDVESVDAILEAVYDTISGPPGPRDWDRFRSLCVPEARLVPVRVAPGGEQARATFMSVEDYAKSSGGYFKQNGFYEREIHRTVEHFGNIAHAFSTYAAYHTADDKEPFMRGINSIQLLKNEGRWWVVQIFWNAERPDNPLPEKYLPR